MFFHIKIKSLHFTVVIKSTFIMLPNPAQCFTVKCALPRNKHVILLATALVNAKQ